MAHIILLPPPISTSITTTHSHLSFTFFLVVQPSHPSYHLYNHGRQNDSLCQRQLQKHRKPITNRCFHRSLQARVWHSQSLDTYQRTKANSTRQRAELMSIVLALEKAATDDCRLYKKERSRSAYLLQVALRHQVPNGLGGQVDLPQLDRD